MILISWEWKKYPPANVCELEITYVSQTFEMRLQSCQPNFASGLKSYLWALPVLKIFTFSLVWLPVSAKDVQQPRILLVLESCDQHWYMDCNTGQMCHCHYERLFCWHTEFGQIVQRYKSWIMHVMGGLDRVLVDTRSSIGQYIGRVLTDVSTDNPIGRNTWRFTDTWPIFHRCFTSVDTRPTRDR